MSYPGLIGFNDPVSQAQLFWFCELISYTVLALTFWYKAPQVYAVLHSGSSLGISMPSLLLEFTSYSIEMTYQVAMVYPILSYVEIIFMWGQDVILLYTVLQNRHMIEKRIIPYVLIYGVIFTLNVTRHFPDIIMSLLIGSTTVILAFSKSIQLWKVIDTENPGSLSALTWGLLSYMAAAKIVTTMVLMNDFLVLLTTAFEAYLDVAVSTAILYHNYLKATKIRARRALRILTNSVMTGDLLMLSNTTLATFMDMSISGSIVYFNRKKAERIRRLAQRRRRERLRRRSRSRSRSGSRTNLNQGRTNQRC